MAAPYRVVSPLPTLAGLERFLAEDATGSKAWIYQAADRAPGADERMLDAAGYCSKPQADLVQVLDLGRDGAGRAWVATAPVHASTLTQLIADHGPLDVAMVVRLCARLAELLEALAAESFFPAISSEAVMVWGTQLQLLGFCPLTAPRTGREQARAVGVLLSLALPVEGRRADVNQLVDRCLTDGADAFSKIGDLAAALHGLVGGDTRPSLRSFEKGNTLTGRSRAGEVLGSYELVSQLGEGGMGDVYLAKHSRLGREVALKLLKPKLAKDADVVRRFFQEARVVNEINHPHIVEVMDFVDDPPHVFCVMELLKGSTLGDLVLAAPLPLRRTADLLQQTCAALHAAHTHGVVHRDVKPANIFVCQRDGDFVKLLDFGIARLLRTSIKESTQVGQVIGTPAYMSPEQAQGRPVDARTDIYAVGAVLFELLGGEPLSRTDRPVLPAKTPLGEPIPRAVAELVARCISMEPSLRPASALEIADVLAEVASPSKPETTQRAIAAAGLGARPRGAGRMKWAVGAAAVLALVGTGIWAVWPAPESPIAVVADVPDAGVAVVEAVVDAGEPAVVVAEEDSPPPKVEPGPGPKKKQNLPARDPLAARFRKMKKTYKELVDRHGAQQLTRGERESVQEAMANFAAEDFRLLAGSLPAAEQALKEAARRLGQ